MPANLRPAIRRLKPEHGPTKNDQVFAAQRRALNVLDRVGNAGGREQCPSLWNQVWVFFWAVLCPLKIAQRRERLARWACPDEIESPEIYRRAECVSLDESIAAIPRLWLDVDACDVESGALKSLGGAARTTEEIECS